MFADMTMQEANYYLLNKLREIKDDSEAGQITDWVMEFITGSGKAERMIYKNSEITEVEESRLRDIAARLMQHEPVQYVLNQAWFCGFRFYVDKNVLIPRPETEELVEWVISNCRFPLSDLSILDIGTGSGCIPVSLKRRLRKASVSAIDISHDALAVAKRNADTLGADVNFIQQNIFDREKWSSHSQYDIIISNPPYIPEKDKAEMEPNVLKFEPASALFVPDDDALLFYREIAAFARQHLTKNGMLYFEIHENLGQSVLSLLEAEGFTAEIKKDMQQKDRMIKSGLK